MTMFKKKLGYRQQRNQGMTLVKIKKKNRLLLQAPRFRQHWPSMKKENSHPSMAAHAFFLTH